MLTNLGADTKKVRTINRTIVLNLIRENGPISKTAVSRQTGISFSTVNRVIDELLAEDLIRPLENRLERGGGRPGEVFAFNGKSHVALGVDIGFPYIRGMIADLSGTIRKEITLPVVRGDGPENYRRLLALLEQLQNSMESGISNISGVGLGIAGAVDHQNGIVLRSALLGWENFPLARRLNRDTGQSRFLIDSDINLITMGEYGFGIGQGVQNLICLTLGTRVLCGLMLGGELYRGSNFNAGRMDDFIPVASPGREENRLENILSAISVLDCAKAALQASGEAAQAETLTEAKQVYQAAAAGQAWAVAVVQKIVPALSVSIANIAALLDPEMVVISGRLAEDAGVLIPYLTAYLNERGVRIPDIQSSPLGTRATVLGAIMLVYRGMLSNW